jgi:hypothetical protein
LAEYPDYPKTGCVVDLDPQGPETLKCHEKAFKIVGSGKE